MNAPKNEFVNFANVLRGLAALSVMLVHYVVMFNALKGAYAGFTPLPYEPYPYLPRAIHLWIPMLDYGSFGVALFFLVSGFVIPFSLKSLGGGALGSFAFLVARVLRLYPTYIVSIGITFGALFAIAYLTGYPRSYSLQEVLNQLSLFRDWFGTVEIGGITWTLEVEVKFYLIAAIFPAALLAGDLRLFGFVWGAALLGDAMNVQFPMHGPELSNVLYAPRYVSYMLIGTAFHLLMKKKIAPPHFAFLAAVPIAILCEIEPRLVSINYIYAALVFATCYFFRDKIKTNKVTDFLADISYPLYVMHAAFGYFGLRLMMGFGLHPLIALPIQIAITIFIARQIHTWVETPTRIWGSKLSKWIVKRGAVKKVPLEMPNETHVHAFQISSEPQHR